MGSPELAQLIGSTWFLGDPEVDDACLLLRLLGEHTCAWTGVLRHGRDVHPTWVKSSIETLSNTRVWVLSARAKSEEDFDSY